MLHDLKLVFDCCIKTFASIPFQLKEQFAKAFPDASEKELVLDYDLKTATPLVTVHHDLCKQLKDHQARLKTKFFIFYVNVSN